MWNKQQKIVSCYLTCFFFIYFFPRNFNTSSIHNQCPVNEMVATDDTGCGKDGRTLFLSCRTEDYRERRHHIGEAFSTLFPS